MSILPGSVVEALTTALVHSTWQIAAVAGVLWLALRMTRESGATIRYALGCGALAAAVLIPLATVAGALSRADEAALRPSVQRGPTPAVLPGRSDTSNGQAPQPPASSDAMLAAAAAWADVWIVPLWLAGVACCSLRLVFSARYARTMRRTGHPAPSSAVDAVQRLAAAMHVRRRIDVMVTALAGSPGTIGWLKPVILLPAAALSGLTPSQLDAILAHEIAHIRRHDYLVNVLQMVAETVCFYHPAMWWISRRIRFERELCCDDAAVHASGDVVTYAHALAAVARQSMAPGLVSAAALSLPDRMRRLLTPRRQPPAATASVAAASVMALGLVAASASWVHGQNGAPGRADQLATLTLTVIDPLGKPARGIPVVFEQGPFQDGEAFGDGLTDRDGRYVVRLPAGTYLFSALVDFFPGTEVSLKAGERVDREVRMKLEPVSGAFTVCIDCDNGVVPAEASVAEELKRDRAEYATALTRTAEPVGGWEGYQVAVPASLRSLGAGVQGAVTVTGLVRRDGRLAELRIVSAAHPALADAALAALEAQRWEPARVGSTVVEVGFVLDLQFVRRAAERPVPLDPPQRRSVMKNITAPVVQLIGALTIAAAAASPVDAQAPDAFRVTGGPNRSEIRTAATPGLDRQLEEAFRSPQALTDLSVTANVTFKQLNSAEYAVPVTVRIAPGAELTVGRGERSRFDFIAAVTDPFGITQVNMRDEGELTLDAASIPALAKTPIVYETSFVLLPGNYTLKVLARDQTTGRLGSANVPFTIPNLARQQRQK